MAPWVDEMFVLDTGSTDATATLAAAVGARVGHFGWVDDFSAARNFALDMADADWHVVMDADEWLVDGGEQISALRNCPPDFVGAVDLHDELGNGVKARSRLSRVFPGTLRYEGRIHEQVQHGLPVKCLNVSIAHDGYQPQQLCDKRGRNRRLLEAALEEAPSDAYIWYQLGKDCDVYDEHALAEAAFSRATLLSNSTRWAWWSDLVLRRLRSLKELGRHEDALSFAADQQSRLQNSPDFNFVLADVLLDMAASSPSEAGTLLPLMEQAWRRCLEIGERPDLVAAVPGRGSWMAAKNLCLLLDATGRMSESRVLRARFPVP
jgi:hypothetical protein